MFSYDEMTTRNQGFVSNDEQNALKSSTVFVCGNGGMGGACIQALVRMGVGKLILADVDEFEISNLNRQVFCNLHRVGLHKSNVTAKMCRNINPEIDIEVYGLEWMELAEGLVSRSDIVVNGTDDLAATLLLYRTAREQNKVMIDAYAAPLPSVYVTKPTDPAHETRLGFQTEQTDWRSISQDQRESAFMAEAEYVVLNSSSRHYIDLDLIGDVITGKRGRPSFAPMVITTGMLMAYECANGVMGRPFGANCQGYFLNPYRGRVERPNPKWMSAVIRPFVRRFLARLLSQ